MKILLASGSPRRRELLERLGAEICVVVPDVEELKEDGESPEEYVKRNARLKASYVSGRCDPTSGYKCIIAADTVVVFGGSVLEKPLDRDQARRMLQSLSGAKHKVLTGFCLLGLGDRQGKTFTDVVSTEVQFKALTELEIEEYLDTGEYIDKAGSYGIQGLASYMVRSIAGSYTNVVGLPLCQVIECLEKALGLKFTVSLA